jgi:hypothetical protein
MGWEDVKSAFRRPNPTARQKEHTEWARMISPLGNAFDPSKAPSVEALNKKDEFEKFAKCCRQGEDDGDTDNT